MPQAQIAQGVQLLDLMLEYFSDARHWARGIMMTETAAPAWSALF